VDLSPFEAIMLICFGLAWPFSIYKSWKTWEVGSKSLVFLVALFVGYVAGTLHKIFYLFDYVIILYILNGTMVATDIVLYIRNRLYQVRKSVEEAQARETNRGSGFLATEDGPGSNGPATDQEDSQ
jgi:hypothetical protein